LLLVEPAKAPAVGTGQAVRPWRRFAALLAGHRPLLAEAVVCALVMTVLGVSTSYFVQHLVDSVLPRGERRLLHAMGIGMGLVVLLLTAILFLYDRSLALAAVAFVPVLVLGVLAHHPAARRRSRDAMEGAARFAARVVEDVSGVETVKAYGAERARAEAAED